MINRLTLDHQQKLDAANRQIDALKTMIATLQKSVDDVHAAQKRSVPAKDAPAAKEGGK